jgi:hypothetical protein
MRRTPVRMRELIAMVVAVALLLTACDSGPSAEEVCLEGIGQMQGAIEEYEDLLDTAVAQMREEGAPEKLEAISEQYGILWNELNQMEAELPVELLDSLRLLVSGVGYQESAWSSIGEGLRYIDRDLINEGAEMIAESRDLLDQSNLALPECSEID